MFYLLSLFGSLEGSLLSAYKGCTNLRMEKMRNVFRNLKESDHLRSSHRWESNVKMDPSEIENGVEPSGSP